jgi:hypothetical protein
VPLSVAILTSMLGASVGFVILRRYYLDHPVLDVVLHMSDIPVTQSPPA